jgi:hypothetical protein
MGMGKIQCQIMKLLISFFLLTISFNSFGQYDSKGNDEVSRFRPGTFWYFNGLRPGKKERARKYDRLIFDVFYNDWTGELKPFNVHPTSIGFSTNLMFDVPITKGNTIAFAWGLNYTLSHIRHDNTLFTNQKDELTVYKTSPINLQSSFNYNQFSIPLELRFRNESWKHFKVHFGGKIGYLAKATEKSVLSDEWGKTVIKDSRFPDLNPLQYSAHIRIGIRNIALFGEYNFSTLFKNEKSTQLNVIRMGLSISLF